MLRLYTLVVPLALVLLGCGDSGGDDGGGNGDDDDSHQGGSAGSGTSGSSGSGAGVSGSGGAGSGTGGTSGTGGSGGGGSGGGKACNTNEPNAPDYPYNFVAEEAPAPTGGTIVDGTYFVTSVTWYESSLAPGSSNTPGGIRIDIAGDQWNEADGSPDGIAPPVHFTFNLEVMSPNLVISQTCPNAGPAEQYAYSAEGDELLVFITDGPEIFGMLLTRQ